MSYLSNLSIDQVFDWHRVNTPNIVYATFSDEDGSRTNITWSDLGSTIYRSVELVKNNIPECVIGNPSERPIIVGILTNSDALTYIAMLQAHVHLTHPKEGRPIVPFLISPRNSAAAVAHLVKEVDVKYLWVTDGATRDIAEEALKVGDHKVQLLKFPSYSDIYETNNPDIVVPEHADNTPVSFDAPALILHSSGSTAFPKPRVISHQAAYQLYGHSAKNCEAKLKGERVAIHPSPIYHALGYICSLWPAAMGATLGVRSPRAPVGPMSPELFLQSIVNDNCDAAVAVPNYLESWSSDPKAVGILQKMKYIYWGGGPLSQRAGEFYYKQNVPIYTVYGATEFGIVMVFPEKPIPEGFEWFRFGVNASPVLFPIEGETDSYKLYFKANTPHWILFPPSTDTFSKQTDDFQLSAINAEIDGCPAYDSNDIVQRHPRNPTLFRIVGRFDEQIMLSTGEKTNPVPLERIMEQDKNIKSAIMFGRGRQSNGVLILPNSFHELEKLGVEGFRNEIWPAIEAANAYAPAHSRIFKEMILLASPSKPFLFTDKRTVKKGLTLKLYTDEIEEIYKAVAESVNTDIPIPQASHPDGGWTDEESLGFVKAVVRSIMKHTKEIGDTTDLFSVGCDSLQATFMKNTFFHALKQVASLNNIRKIPSNFVYQFPTIQGLSQYLAKMSRAGISEETADPRIERRKRLESYVHKFTQNWPVHKPQRAAKDEVVLLTGSTGGLGSQLLAQLVQIPSVSRIYAFNRKSSKTPYERHLTAFKDRGNDVDLLNSPKIVFVVGDTSESGFGIDGELFRQMQESVTTIIHNAWQVNFNITLASFEPAVRGVRNFVDFALNSPLSSPPTLLFTSTIGIIKDWADIPNVPERPVTDIDIISQSGYGESKWVSERILAIAEENTALKPVIVRVGQLSGGINGNWNTREWFPALVRGGQVVGGLPDNEGTTSFVPLHVAASTIIELRSAPINVAHLVHPRPTPWKTLIQYVSEIVNLPLIPYEEWFNRLEKSPRTASTLETNPALHLLDFYRAGIPPKGYKGTEGRESMGLAMYDTSRTTSAAHSLDEDHLPQLSKEEVERWIGYWRAKGALE